jgi:NarL family two-component system response regulator LiaR
MSTTKIRVVLADDHAVVRKGIREFLEEDGDIEVVAEAADGEAVKQLILEYQPDVAILDIRMPGATGIEVTEWLHQQGLPAKVLLLTAYDNQPYVTAALQAGVNGYVLKDADAKQIAAAVRAVYYGYSALTASITVRAFASDNAHSRADALVEPLTDRELEVLRFAGHGLTNRGIAVKLGISDRTVQNHLANVFAKLAVGSRTEAVTRALQLGLFTLPESEE